MPSTRRWDLLRRDFCRGYAGSGTWGPRLRNPSLRWTLWSQLPVCSGLRPKPEKLTVRMEAKSDGPDLVQIKHRGTSPAIGQQVSAESHEQPSEPSPVDPTAKPEGLSCPGA